MVIHARVATMAAHFVSGGDASGEGPPSELTTDGVKRSNGDRDVVTVDAVIAALGSVPVDILRLIEGKSADELSQPAQDGGWGLVEILPHFRDWEEIIDARVTAILTEDEPGLEEFDDSLWAIEHGYRDQATRAAFEEFAARRNALVERLSALAEEDWNRIGVLPKQGRVSLLWLMNSVCNHDAKHVVQARDVLA